MILFTIFVAMLWVGLGVGIVCLIPEDERKFSDYVIGIVLAPFNIGFLLPTWMEHIYKSKNDF